jgi:hypothetical protein
MRNLEKLVTEWRKKAATDRRLQPEMLDELESHLRETAESFVRSGMTERDALQRALDQLGAIPAISAEFKKLEPPVWLPVKIALGVGAIATLTTALFLIARLESGRVSLLLASHVLMITLGYGTTFLIGALGICFVGQRCFSDLSPSRAGSFSRAVFKLNVIAAALTAIGTILAMVWAKNAWHRYWGWDAKEIGALCVMVWQISFLLLHRFVNSTTRAVLCLFGNIVVSCGWFGANLLGELHRHGTPNYFVIVLAAIVANGVLMVLALAPAGWLRRLRAF